jgi:hypothetical protein
MARLVLFFCCRPIFSDRGQQITDEDDLPQFEEMPPSPVAPDDRVP